MPDIVRGIKATQLKHLLAREYLSVSVLENLGLQILEKEQAWVNILGSVLVLWSLKYLWDPWMEIRQTNGCIRLELRRNFKAEDTYLGITSL